MAKVGKSPWVLHYDGSSCNGCDIETLACLTPVYDAERFGIVNTGDPFQADIFLITGGINKQNEPVVKQLYSQMPRPKVVVAVGTCACTGGIFKDTYNILGGADVAIPVDIYVPGCAARPQSIIDGIVQAIALFQKRSDEHDEKLRKEQGGSKKGKSGKASAGKKREKPLSPEQKARREREDRRRRVESKERAARKERLANEEYSEASEVRDADDNA